MRRRVTVLVLCVCLSVTTPSVVTTLKMSRVRRGYLSLASQTTLMTLQLPISTGPPSSGTFRHTHLGIRTEPCPSIRGTEFLALKVSLAGAESVTCGLVESDKSSVASDSAQPVQAIVSRRFTDSQRATLNTYYRAGMKGVGARHMSSIVCCSHDIGCSIDKVEVSIDAHRMNSCLITCLTDVDQEELPN